MSGERNRISVCIAHDIATQTIIELFSLRLTNRFNRKKSPRNFKRSLFFLPECEYWVHKSNLPPAVLDNFKFFFLSFITLWDANLLPMIKPLLFFDSSFPKIKLYFPTDLDQHKFSLETIEDALLIQKKSKKDSVWIYDIWNSFMNSKQNHLKRKN